jgi:hypothetical protein
MTGFGRTVNYSTLGRMNQRTLGGLAVGLHIKSYKGQPDYDLQYQPAGYCSGPFQLSLGIICVTQAFGLSQDRFFVMPDL